MIIGVGELGLGVRERDDGGGGKCKVKNARCKVQSAKCKVKIARCKMQVAN